MEQIPPEALAQIPEPLRAQVRQMIESGAIPRTAGQAAAGAPAAPGAAPLGQAPSGEEAMLREIASRSTEPLLAYATDEDTTYFSPDPRTWRFDVGADPVAWARDRSALVDRRLGEIRDWAVKDQESWYHLTDAFFTLMVEKAIVLDYVGRYIGGQYFNRSHKGDPEAQPPFVLVEPAVQREALAFVESSLYDDEFFHVPPDLLNHLAPPRWWHWGTSVSLAMDFPIHDLIGILQWWNLFDRLLPNTLRRIQDAELKTEAEDRITAAEYVRRLRDGVWAVTVAPGRVRSEGWSDSRPYVSDIRRSLQREYLALVEPLVRSRPGTILSPDLHAMVSWSMQELSADIAEVLEGGTVDFASEAHLRRCKSRIDRMLEPQLDEKEPRAPIAVF
jgi:hypothetical protein